MIDSNIAFPCLWTDCGCIADGDHLLECPELDSFCTEMPTPAPTPIGGPHECESFCLKENLSARFQNWTLGSGSEKSYCYYYKHHRTLCEASYLQTPAYRNGLTVPCLWTGDDCVAQDSGGVVCSDFVCGAGLLASKS